MTPLLPHRLEAATSRLEDIAQSALELPQGVPGLHVATATPTVASTPTAQAPPPAPAPPSAPAAAPTPPPPPPEPLPEFVEEFDNFLSQSVDKWAKLSDAIGGLVAEQASKFVEALKEQRKFLLITSKAKKPDVPVLQDLLKPVGDLMMAISNIKDSNRGSSHYDNLSTVAEGVMALGWITVDTKPFKHVEEFLNSAQFWGNKVLTANKNK